MNTKYTPENTALLLVDHQDMTVSWIQSQDKEVVVANVGMLARLGNELKIPTLVTSTMEENVGTNIEIIQKLAPEAYKNRIKRGGTLDCFLDDNFTKAVADLGRNHLIIAGLTTDICLYHTAVHAKKLGYNVMVVGDACGSTSKIADDLSFERLRNNNIEVVSASQALTELYTDFGTEDGQKAMQINLEEVIQKLGIN